MRLLLATAVVIACLVGGTGCGGDGEHGGAVREDGRFLTDEEGRTLILHGMNVSGSAKGHPQRMPWVTRADVQRLAHDWGFNLARFLVFWDAAEPSPGVFDEAYFDRIEERLDWFHEAGIYVVLDMHQDVYSQVFCCDGAPLWAVRDDGIEFVQQPQWNLNYFTEAVMRVWDNFWDYDGPHGDLQDHYADMWVRLAERFKDHPAVLGYDLMNEPAAGSHVPFLAAVSGVDPGGTAPLFDQTVFQDFYERLIARIRTVDRDGWIFYEPRYAGPADGARSFLDVLDDPRPGANRLAYFPHYYPVAAELSGSYVSSGASLEKWKASRAVEIAAQQAPLLIGEFGVLEGFAFGLEHLREVLATADAMTSGWAYWAYDRGAGWDFLNADGSEKEKANVLVRAYPRRIAGEPVSYGYDPESRVLQLTFVGKPGVSGPTEIYVPARRFYPEGWEVAVSDPAGTWTSEWDAERELLFVTASDTADAHSICVFPSGSDCSEGAFD